MRRVAVYGIGWLAAATVAVLLSWQGVARVGTNVTDRHPRALSAEEARAALASPSRPGSGQSPPVTAPAAPSGGSGQSTPPTTARQRAGTGKTTTTAAPRPSPPLAPVPPTTTSTSRPGTPAPPPTSTGVVRTYNLVGGSATLRFEPSRVTVVWADPNPGFRVEVDDRSDGGVRIRFDSDSHRSEIEAWWDGGPRDQVEESGGGSGPG